MQEPVNVSPLIKFGRYSMLVVGILYGIVHKRRLTKREEHIREVEAEDKIKRDAILAAKKKIATDNENRALELLSRKPVLKSDESEHQNIYGNDDSYGHQ